MASYGAVTATLLSMAGGDTARVTENLASADQEIDEAFAAGGYATPIDLSALAVGDARDRLTARLSACSKNICAWRLSSPAAAKQGTPDWVKKNYENERAWLDRISSGSILIAILSGTLTSSRGGMFVVGDATWAADALFFDAVNVPWEN